MRNHLQWGIPPFPRKEERRRDRRNTDCNILPAIQRPLPIPRKLPSMREREKIRDRPLISIRTSRPDDVAKQMQVKRQQNKHRHGKSFARKNRSETSSHDCSTEIVSQNMMIIRPPKQRLLGIAGEIFPDNTEPIKVRRNPGHRNNRPITTGRFRKRVCNAPAQQEVSNRIHTGERSRFEARAFCSSFSFFELSCSISQYLRKHRHGFNPEFYSTPYSGSIHTYERQSR